METVISYCTNDFRFIELNVKQCLQFSERVIIPMCDHMYDGTPENYDLFVKTKELENIGNVVVIPFEWSSKHDSRYWHNMARWVGHQEARSEYVLHIDADEVFDAGLMNGFLSTEEYKSYDVCSFECYWYFRDPTYRARQTEMAGSMFKKSAWTKELAFNPNERWGYRYYPSTLTYKEHCTYNGQVICNHFSWVRSKEEMLTKVKTWGHNNDRDWTRAVHEEFNRPFNGRDFVHGYTYDIVENKFNV